MNLGKALSFISPLAGAITGEGIGKALPYLSPLYGMASGKGPFPDLLSSLFGAASQHQQVPTDGAPAPAQDPAGMNDFLGGLLFHLLQRR